MTTDCSLTQFWFFFLPFLFSLTHLWSSFICSLLVWTQTIGLSSLPPSQSSVEHKEFKRCGPFDPYINAKVCTQCCWDNISFWSASLLSCCVGLLCLDSVCCCCCCCCCCLCGLSAAEMWGGFSFHQLSVDPFPLAFCSCSLVISIFIKILWQRITTCPPSQKVISLLHVLEMLYQLFDQGQKLTGLKTKIP